MKNQKSLARLKEIETELQDNHDKRESLNAEKLKLQNQAILPKVTEKHLGKYFLKTDSFNKKEKMLIHVREIVSSYEYRGVKIQITENGTLTVQPNYLGHFDSIGKQVDQKTWQETVAKADDIISKI